MSPDHAHGRQAILEQAQKLFLAHGYHGVSIRDIVQACGLSNAALYYHFESKQALFLEMFRDYVATVVQRLIASDTGVGLCRERLARVALAYAQIIIESQTESQIIARDVLEFNNEEDRQLIHATQGKIIATFGGILQQGIASGQVRNIDPEQMSMMLLGMINTLAIHYLFARQEDRLAAEIPALVDTLFEGIAAS